MTSDDICLENQRGCATPKNYLTATMTEVNNASTIISINHNTLH
jgi:hypothetical protein